MIESLDNYPKEALVSMLLEKNIALEEKESQLSGKDAQIHQLKYLISLYQQKLFCAKKEKHIAENPTQIQIPFEEKLDLDLPQDQEPEKVTYQRKKSNKKRTDYSKLELPESFERVDIVIEPKDKTEGMVKVSEEITELLCFEPGRFYVKRFIRPKYSLPGKEGILIADLPSRVIPGGKVDESFILKLLIDKYMYHLPLYRQGMQCRQMGLRISDATMGDWTAKGIDQLVYIYNRIKEKICRSHYLQADETTMRILDKIKKGKTHLGYYWVYYAIEEKLALFSYSPGRGHGVPLEMLETFSGYLQTDGLEQYETLQRKRPGIILAGCMAHARRKFFEARDYHRQKADWMLDKIQELYAIEEVARQEKYTHQERLALRQTKSIPILDEMKIWLEEELKKELLLTTPLKTALRYMTQRWDKLNLFTQNGLLEIDNNLVENAIRPVALGRKNYLFAGSHQAAQRGAVIYSLIATCRLNKVNPEKWLAEVLSRLPDTKQSQLDDLLPHNFIEKYPIH